MADYQRKAHRFFFTGISTLPSDALPPGKLPFGKNVRSYTEGVITPRDGLTAVTGSPLGAAVHSLGRLNDPTPFNGGDSALRVIGAGSSLFAGDPLGSSYPSVDSGYSGDPLSMLSAQPPRSPRPYLYVNDADRMRKLLSDGSDFQQGISQPMDPSTEPSAAVQALKSRIIFGGLNDLGVTWISVGASPNGPNPIPGTRISTVIGQILYDQGTTGYASIVPGAMTSITTGAVVSIGGERTIITDLTIAVASTTVEAIIYDSGTTGFCTIQPAGSLGTGQLDAPTWAEANRYRQESTGVRYATPRGTVGVTAIPTPTDAKRRRIRQQDFPVNCIITLSGTETVRILSVAVGADGRQSFRCFTTGVHGPGAAIVGLAAFRVYLAGTHAPGAVIIDENVVRVLNYPVLPVQEEDDTTETNVRVTGGVQSIQDLNLAQFSDGTAVLPEDELHITIKVSRMTEVKTVRFYIDVDPDGGTVGKFLRNYYFYEWRASDIIEAIQATNAASVTPLVEARQTVITNAQLDAQLADLQTQYESGEISGWQLWIRRQQARIAATESAQYDESGRSRRLNTGTTATSDQALTTEMAMGDEQWVDLRCKVRDLIRVGTDTTRTLANVRAVQMLLAAETVGTANGQPLAVGQLTCEFGDVWVAGGSGPDVGSTGDPYRYRYRYRSSDTGVWSNPSPELRGGVIPRRQTVNLVAVPSGDPQVDKIDWFRMGATLTQYTYIGTGPNSTDPYGDTLPDSGVDGAPTIDYDYFQPWPTEDIPHTGTCDVAGTAIRRVSGDPFDTDWAAGSPMIINGRPATLWASPASGDLLFVNENMQSGSGAAFEVIGATKLSQPLRSFWGDYQGLWFACGDPDNPGTLYWTHGNNPECARDVDTLIVAPPSEPLQGGGIYNTFPFVFSNEQFYQLLLNASPGSSRVRAIRTPCGRGSWTPWSYCIGIEGIYFLSDDGIYLTAGGSGAVSLTNPDLRSLFPKDGVPGTSLPHIASPDMTATNDLRLSYIAGFVYFDYLGQDDDYHTLIFEVATQRWFYDECAGLGLSVRVEEPGAEVFDHIIGATNGNLYQYDADAFSDDGTDIAWNVWTNLDDGGQPRVTKQFGDAIVSAANRGNANGISCQVIVNDGETELIAEIVGVGDTGRDTYVLDINDGNGIIARNLGLQIAGVVADGDPGRPELYLWESTFLFKGDDLELRATDWDNLGYQGTKFVQGLILNANTFGEDKEIQIQQDGGEAAITLTINHDGEIVKEYPRDTQIEPGWTPFLSHMVRIIGLDDVQWQILGYRFVYEPHPELATQWETQFTSHDLKGYMSVRDAVIAYCAEGEVRLRVIYDSGIGTTVADRYKIFDYTLPATGGTEMEHYDRFYLPLVGRKGRAVQYQLRSGCPFRLFKRDCSVRVYDWGSGSQYLQSIPFGGPHRADGAAI